MAAATSSQASTASEVLNLKATPAVLEWYDATSEPRSTCHLAQSSDSSPINLSLFFDPSSNSAFFKLRIAVAVEGTTPQDEVKIFVYIFIRPEQVLSLVGEEVDKLPGSVISPAVRLSTCKLMCLRFVLSEPVSVVAPVDATGQSKAIIDSNLLNMLDLLTRQNALAIYVALDALPNSKRVQLLCRASSNGSLKSHPKHADLSGLYGGRGGTVIESLAGLVRPGDYGQVKGKLPERDATAEKQDTLETPPSYDEVAPPPAFSRKRRRVSFESAASAKDHGSILDMCGKLIARQQAELQNGIIARMDERLEKMEARLVQRLDEQVAELKVEICQQMEERMDERIDGVTIDVDNIIDERIDDSVIGIKMDLERFVKDEVRNVEDDIRDDLQDGSFTIQFNSKS
ncbi:hypothetical protein VPNG_03443 [Cytospora leucostoma]|uniref:Uncharacterized protein n=1 Tax=Cytospora leucostoma TaxID=1230097 RepID=A0A423XG56_9PEZI|nr:hypothetical protein VPNG_03443 [Cytospora leucostoma]